jgi:hypothetical protein
VAWQLLTRQPFSSTRISVRSYASEAAFLAGAGHLWNSELDMPGEAIGHPLADAVDAWLIASGISPFAGGEIVGDQSETLATAKDRAWNAIKRARDQAEAANFTWDGHVFDADKARISGAALAALMAITAGEAFSTTFTLANNDPIVLDASQMMGVGAALMQHVDGVFAIARGLRETLFSDETDTIAKVTAITWPA